MLFRIFLKNISAELSLTDDYYNYLVRTLRLQAGDLFEIVNGLPEVHVFKIITADKKKLQAEFVEKYPENNEPAVKLTLIQPLLKGEKLDYVLQKSTELGVSNFLLYQAERSSIKITEQNKKLLRWQKIIEAAVCQSRRSFLPELKLYNGLAALLPKMSIPLYFAAPTAAANPNFVVNELAVVVGPESGFSEEESALLQKSGQAVSLGKTTLRTETASVALCAKILI